MQSQLGNAYIDDGSYKNLSITIGQEVVLGHVIPDFWALSLAQQQHLQLFSDILII